MDETKSENYLAKLEYKWWQIVLIFVSALFSMVEKVSICGFDLTGKHFIYFAGLLLILPIILLVLSNGGYFKFGSFELRLDLFKKFVVKDLQMKIEKLRIEFYDYRNKYEGKIHYVKDETNSDVGKSFEEIGTPEVLEKDKSEFMNAIQEYKHYKVGKLWEKRNNVDLKLLRLSPRLNFRFLEEVYKTNPSDKETLMAVAVCLGYTYEKGNEEDVIGLLETLINSNYGWVKKRVIRSIEWRLDRSETSVFSKTKLIDLLKSQQKQESKEEIKRLLEIILNRL